MGTLWWWHWAWVHYGHEWNRNMGTLKSDFWMINLRNRSSKFDPSFNTVGCLKNKVHVCSYIMVEFEHVQGCIMV